MLAGLAILTTAFAVLAVVMSPGGTSLTVQNGATDTFGAHSFSLDLTSSVSAGKGTGTITQVRLITYSAPSHMVVKRISPVAGVLGKLQPDAISMVINGYIAVTSGPTPWIRHGSSFTRTESLVNFTARVSHEKSAQGKVYETAMLNDGYLDYVNLKVVVPSQKLAGGKTAVGGVVGETFRLLRINGIAQPAV